MDEFENLSRTIIERNIFFVEILNKNRAKIDQNTTFLLKFMLFSTKNDIFSKFNLGRFDGKLIFRIKFIYLETIKHHKFLSKITDKSQFSWS